MTSLIAAVLSSFGFINAPQIAWPTSLSAVTLGYLALAIVLGGFALADRGRKAEGIDNALLFVTGDLASGGSRHGLLTGAELVAPVTTAAKYGLAEGKASHALIPGGEAVHGELYQVTSDVLVTLVEGQPEGVKRQSVDLSDGRTVPGLAKAVAG